MTTSPPGSLALPNSLFCLFLRNMGSGERVGALRVLVGVGGDLKDDSVMINLLLDYFFSICASLRASAWFSSCTPRGASSPRGGQEGGWAVLNPLFPDFLLPPQCPACPLASSAVFSPSSTSWLTPSGRASWGSTGTRPITSSPQVRLGPGGGSRALFFCSFGAFSPKSSRTRHNFARGNPPGTPSG